jgi:hypothetical protein
MFYIKTLPSILSCEYNRGQEKWKMKKRNLWLILAGLLIVVVIFFYPFNGSTSSIPEEQTVVTLPLSGPLSEPRAEISGLAWYDDNLILLPQYPIVFDESSDGLLYYLPKEELLAYLDGTSTTALEPRPIQLIAPDLADQIRNFQGFESIGFSDSQAFLTIESGDGTDMEGYLISGMISPDLSQLELDTTKLASIDPQAVSANHTDESILVFEDKIVTFYEVNGEAIVADPVAHVFDFDLNPIGTIPMTNVEYRLTDTALSSANEFWGIDYFYPGDTDLLPKADPITDTYGKGNTQSKFDHIERLVKFTYSDDGIDFAKTAPIPLVLTEDIRNWEGLAILDDRGFLLATDKFPVTILGFVPFP